MSTVLCKIPYKFCEEVEKTNEINEENAVLMLTELFEMELFLYAKLNSLK